jgi:hypothetical protein
VSRKVVLIALLAAGVFVAPARAQPVQLIPGTPGLTYQKQAIFTIHGLVGLKVMTAPRPGGLWSLQPVLSNELIQGTEKLTAIEKRLSASATTAGVNGDVVGPGGRPDGLLERNGVLDHDPRTARTSIGIDGTGALHFDRISLYGYWQGAKSRHVFANVNEPPLAGQSTLYTPAWGPSTPSTVGSVAAVLRPFPAATPNTDLVGTSAQVVPGGAVAIPPDGAVLVGRGAAGTALQNEAPAGQAVHVRFAEQPDWPSLGVAAAVGGGPLLVKNGKAVLNANESLSVTDLAFREPRTAVGQRADGSLLFVTVDGGLPGSGLTNFELAQQMVRLGAVTASALAAGPTSGMAFDGHLLSTPAGTEQPLADALLVEYVGVYAAPPSAQVVSPNNDGVAENEMFAYKVVRPSDVTVQLRGPDGVLRVNQQSQLQPGTYTLPWNARKADGTPEQEGAWAFIVSATDDLGRASSMERDFTLDLTLGRAAPVTPALAVPRAKPRGVATFQLTRRARVTERIETTGGVVVRKLGTVTTGPGPLTVAWDGKVASGASVYGGKYLVHVTAQSSIGTSDLSATFSVRRK